MNNPRYDKPQISRMTAWVGTITGLVVFLGLCILGYYTGKSGLLIGSGIMFIMYMIGFIILITDFFQQRQWKQKT